MGMKTKELQSAYMKEWRAANQDKVKANFQKWTEANTEHRAAYQKDYMQGYQQLETSQAATWVRNLLRNYRMTPQDFNDLWVKQSGKCEICAVSMSRRGR